MRAFIDNKNQPKMHFNRKCNICVECHTKCMLPFRKTTKVRYWKKFNDKPILPKYMICRVFS